MKKHILLAIPQTIVLITWAEAALQAPFDLQREDHYVGNSGHPADLPHVDYTALDRDDDGTSPPPEGMVLYPLHVSGPSEDRVNLMFFSDGCEYFGINSDKPEKHGNAKWKDFLSEPGSPRIEDAKVPLQEYPWYDLDISPWSVSFSSSNSDPALIDYPTALLRASVSSIPDPFHIAFVINDQTLDLTETFPPEWQGSLDRRWLEVDLVHGRELVSGINSVNISLTENDKKAQAGKGGKMITSLEIIEYGGEGRFNHSEGVIGLFPTYAMDGRVRLRPTNEGCLMRNVNHPSMYITSTRLASAQYVHII
ncbi:hypothetical protein I350_02289 [Cryptococcus amylolentus CBS 6273]|uniref:F5/8 type C domain-containing protein n=1 Tax=Cryptococcus amylolentus CBS 6273 TaxID=1296118 RepID=A0A1E3KB58_9TREE|nr:hypothetical protein I350_02289 [Cryptococcus amylolentus CBS 6273]